ncbi:hypothetical protein Tco_0386497 [Tanacetum coccineum]
MILISIHKFQELMDELVIFLLQFDRAGYRESDLNPKRLLKSEASDIEVLADPLKAGVVVAVSFLNYRWPSLPYDLILDDYRKKLSKFMLWIGRHTPGLLHWWLTQKVYSSSSLLDKNAKFFSTKDLEVMKNNLPY